MAIERGRFVDLPGTTKWLVDADKQDEGSSNLDPAFDLDGLSALLRSASSARTSANPNTPAERAYTRMSYALNVGHLVLGKRFRVARLARCVGTGTTPAAHVLFQLVQADAARANERSGVVVWVSMLVEGKRLKERLPLQGLRFSVATPLNLMSGWTGSKGPRKMWAFRAAILELGQSILLAVDVGRICDRIGPTIAPMTAAIGKLRCITSFPERTIGTTRCSSLKRVRCCMLQKICAGMVSVFSTVADEHSTPPQSRRLLGSYSNCEALGRRR